MPDNMDARTRDRLKALCKVGRLFDAQRLLEEVGTAKLRKTRKWTPLLTAVDRGFHSLVELLLRYEHAQWDLDKGYRAAKWRHRPDSAGLILRSSSWSGPIDPVEALVTGDLELVQRLRDAGTDFTAGDSGVTIYETLRRRLGGAWFRGLPKSNRAHRPFAGMGGACSRPGRTTFRAGDLP
jgi:hypothetical protein